MPFFKIGSKQPNQFNSYTQWFCQGFIISQVVTESGGLKTADGELHKTPSGAAKHLNGSKPVDGWLAWKTKATGVSLAELRSKLS